MPRDDRSYSSAMRAYDEEKKFLRKVRHRAFHPSYDSPILFRLAGYLVRMVVIGVILLLVLFVRNRRYFSSESFSDGVQEQLDRYMHAEDSQMEPIYWKSGQAVTSFKAKGGARSFFREIDIPRIAARGRWRDLLLQDNWQLSDVQVANAVVKLKAGPTPGAAESEAPAEFKSSSWLSAVPDFSKTRFGDIALHNIGFEWGPHWTSEGSLTACSGTAKRALGEWTITLTSGVFQQNWLKDLKVQSSDPLTLTLKDNQINLSGSNLQLGQLGSVDLQGNITLSETPEFNIRLDMESVEVNDILPWQYHSTFSGLADIVVTLTGSPNKSDGIIFDGEIEMVEKGRLREIPILRTLSVVTPRIEMAHMPLRPGSKIKFKTRQGLLTVSDIKIKGGGSQQSGIGFKNSSGVIQDFARMVGSFTYQLDTSALDQALVLEDIKRPGVNEDSEIEDPNAGFKGEVQIAMPWELLGRDDGYRNRFFKPDKEEYGWITVAFDGPLESISKTQATTMDQAWAELQVRRQNPFD